MRIRRPKELYNHTDSKGQFHGGVLGIGKDKFWKDYVYHAGGDEFVPGTNVPRLKPINLGPNSTGFYDTGVRALTEGLSGAINTLRRLRDAKGTYLPTTEVTNQEAKREEQTKPERPCSERSGNPPRWMNPGEVDDCDVCHTPADSSWSTCHRSP